MMKKNVVMALILGYAWTGFAMETVVEQKETQAPAISPKIVVPPKDLLTTGMIGDVYNQTDVWLTFKNPNFPFLMLYPSCQKYEKDSNGNFVYEKDVNGNPTTQLKCLKYEKDSNGNFVYEKDANGNLTTQRQCLTTCLFMNSFLSSSYRSDQGLFFNQLLDPGSTTTVTLQSALNKDTNPLTITLGFDKNLRVDTSGTLIDTNKNDQNHYMIALSDLFSPLDPKAPNAFNVFNKVIQDYWEYDDNKDPKNGIKQQYSEFAKGDYAAGSKLFDRIVIRNWFVSFDIDATNKLVETDIYVLCDFERKSTMTTTKKVLEQVPMSSQTITISTKTTTEDIYKPVATIFIKISQVYLRNFKDDNGMSRSLIFQ